MKKLVEFNSQDVDRNLFHVMLRPTEKCNYNCAYCFLHDNSKKECQYSDFRKYLRFIDMIPKDHSLYFYIHGGEPSLYPDFFIFLEDLFKSIDIQKRKAIIEIQTNGSAKLEFFKNANSLMKDFSIEAKFSVSYHSQSNIVEFLRKMIFLNDVGLLNRVDFMCHSKNAGKVINYLRLIQKIIKNRCFLSLIFNELDELLKDKTIQKIVDDDTERFVAIYEDGTREILDFHSVMLSKFPFNDMICHAGKDGILFNADGYCYRCITELISEKKGFAFSFIDNDTDRVNDKFRSMVQLRKCEFDSCICDLEFRRFLKHEK